MHIISHLERLLGSLDGCEGGGIETGVTSTVVARESTWGGGSLVGNR